MFGAIRTLSRSGQVRNFIRRLNTSHFAQFNSVEHSPDWRLSLKERTGLFELPELASPHGFIILRDKAITEAENLIAEAVSPDRKRKMVQIFDDLSDCLCRVADLAEFVRTGHPDARFSSAAREASVAISSLVEQLNTNVALYSALRSVVEGEDIVPTNAIEKHVGRLFLFDFEQCGIHLDERTRKDVVALNDHILYTGSYFLQNSQKPRVVSNKVLPQNLRPFFNPNETSTFAVTGLNADSPQEAIRETTYKIFLLPDDEQMSLLDNLLESRQELAQLCGFKTHAHRVLKGSIADTPENVHSFLSYLSKELRPRAEKDYQEMLRMKKTCSRHVKSLEAWDIPFFSSQAKLNKFVLSPQEYMAYLSLSTCMEGLDMIFQSLYGVTIRVADPLPGELWHPSVIKMIVKDTRISDDPIGIIYCDLFERAQKPHQDCHFTIQGGRRKADGSYQIPKVVLMLNLPRASPPLLTPASMDNLFHEMGHAMHSMLARTEYQHVTGTRCATDLAEVPSILMEYFASDPRVVTRFARHYKTGEPMPAILASNLEASRVIFQASETQLQVFYAFVDHAYHSQYPRQKSTTEILREVQNEHYGVPFVENTAWQLRFGHLVGYGAKYYSYLMSRAVAASFWQKAFKADPLSREAGLSYREKVLAHGGSLPPAELVRDFLGLERLNTQKLAEALIRDIDHRSPQSDS
ncbi:mitochondrial intermediate peptidase [Galendromus occidentalis]|uniref:Mitochondrial intermediate peptidase n=1 Tax=Galendromus occidentalis TaxID=34638 RepID=A0AAJ6VVE6_9ACAR|nr:mitochondrial intermediate peptidase [Galendromus occidentalis]